MSARPIRPVEAQKAADTPALPTLTPRPPSTGPSSVSARLAAPQTLADAEQRYVAARNAWTAAMRAASSGRPADLASLAITQEAYEAAAAEFESWRSGERLAIRIRPETTQRGVSAAIGQELAWRRVRESDAKPPSLLARLARKLRRR